jgi:hypothetical protein
VHTNSTRLARNLSAAVVAGIAAWSSYRHMVTVALGVGEQPEVAYVLPLSVDGMLVVASIAMVDDRRSGRNVRWSARLAFAAGVLASVAANVSAAHPTLGARIVASWPALALLLTVELLSRSGRPSKKQSTVVDPMVVRDAPPMHAARATAPNPALAATPNTPVGAPVRSLSSVRPASATGRQSVTASANRASTRTDASRPRRPVAETIALVQAIEAERPDATPADIAAQLGISTRRLREVLATAA